MEAEKNHMRSNEIQLGRVLTWASRFEGASCGAKPMVTAERVNRIRMKKDCGITISWHMPADRLPGKKTEASALPQLCFWALGLFCSVKCNMLKRQAFPEQRRK